MCICVVACAHAHMRAHAHTHACMCAVRTRGCIVPIVILLPHMPMDRLTSDSQKKLNPQFVYGTMLVLLALCMYGASA